MKKILLPSLIATFLLISSGFAVSQTGLTLADQLRELATTHNFILRGAEKAQDYPASSRTGEIAVRLRNMLENFDFVLIQPPAGKVSKLIIIGRKNPAAPPVPVAQPVQADTPAETDTPAEAAATPVEQAKSLIINTHKEGSHHQVSATLVGVTGERVQTNLIVDTGATSVVLPISLVPRLGISGSSLTQRKVQTANGETIASITTLPEMLLGNRSITNVEVAFIEDDMLGGTALLGMSVLGRYKVILDDTANTLVLESK